MRRALRSLMPALAAANSWDLSLRCVHVEANLVIGDVGVLALGRPLLET